MSILLALIPIVIASITGLVVLSWKLASQDKTVGQDDVDLVPSEPVVDAQPVEEYPDFAFTLTDAARDKVRALLADVPHATHLVVSLDYDGQSKYDYNYLLTLERRVSPLKFHFLQSNGIDVAVSREHIKSLNGVTLDWIRREPGVEGFDLSNPNPFDWREGQKVSVEQTRHIDPAVEAPRLLTPQRNEAYQRLRLWWLAHETKSGILCSDDIGLVESYAINGEPIYVIFSGEPGKREDGICVVDAQGRTVPITGGYNYLSENDRFVDVDGDGVPEIIDVLQCGGNRSDGRYDHATSLIVVPIIRGKQPLLHVLFDKRKSFNNETWTWELDDSDRKGATIRLYPSPDRRAIAEFVWQPELQAFSCPPGSQEEGFLARPRQLSFKEEIDPFNRSDD